MLLGRCLSSYEGLSLPDPSGKFLCPTAAIDNVSRQSDNNYGVADPPDSNAGTRTREDFGPQDKPTVPMINGPYVQTID
jgi:hypothetical protein